MAALVSYLEMIPTQFGIVCCRLRAGDLAHSVVEGQTEDLDKEVNGVAGQVALGPAPVAVFDEQARISGYFKVVCGALDELEPSFLEQGRQRGHSGGTDLVAAPAWAGFVRGLGCHGRFSNAAE